MSVSFQEDLHDIGISTNYVLAMGWKKMQIQERYQHVLQNGIHVTQKMKATKRMRTLVTIKLSNLQERDRTLGYCRMTNTDLINQDVQSCFDWRG